ncbi:Major facilitator superfamily domain,Major facilitator, sugar transporter-like [Cinara cedri]|uniref:Major facilitator superfamily domain,Major facilitator, sugar transporter-like n=1 Tax=Cinara cedri TaxID=506608 RepID=A0A5E4MCD2_9HEMI|nr:Major facilitator superfamily domain,Major facilitator, sugar transporter-like [Cinara cedri]
MNHAQLICHLKLMFCTIIMCFPQIIIGGSFIFSSTLLEQLREPSSSINLNIDQESWIASISVLLCPVGFLAVGLLTDKYGRRKTLQIIYVPLILSWITFIIADSYRMLVTARILMGIPLSAATCTTMYIVESCPANVRSLHFSLVTVCSSTGMMLECILSIYYHWKTISAIMCVMCVVNLLTLFSVPEPSIWLRAKGRIEEAEKVDKWFDLRHITVANAAESSANTVNKGDGPHLENTTDTKDKPYWLLFIHPTVWKPTLILLIFYICQQGSGLYVLLFYTMDVLRDFRVPWDSNTVSIFLSVARLLGGISFGLLHWCKKRTMVAISGGSMAGSLIIAIAYSKMFINVEHPPYMVILVFAFVAYMFFALIGLLTMPWVLSSELYPISVKGVMNGLASSFGYVICFFVCKIYPYMIKYFGVEIVWSIFALFCLLTVLFAIFIMPETKGKSLEEILSYFESHKDIKNKNVP